MDRGWLRRTGGFCALFAATLSLCLVALASTPGGSDLFVRVHGTSFVLHGKAFRFVGANVSLMHGERKRRSYERLLDAVHKDGLKVVRIWAFGEQAGPGKEHHRHYAFRIGEHGWVEGSFEHLDRVLAAARKRGLRVILVLANRWKDYGGIATYLHWSRLPVPRDKHGQPSEAALTAFYRSERCKQLYREHVARVVGRVNSVTRLPYRDDPTIFAWELINEASASNAYQEGALVSWVRDTARYVKALDPNHMISAGHIGYSSARERRVWERVQALREVAFADVHSYPYVDARVPTPLHLASVIDDPVHVAERVLRKPLVFGEFGIPRSGVFADMKRALWMQLFLSHASESGAAGALAWVYEPSDSPRSKHSITESPKDEASLRIRRVLTSAAYSFRARSGQSPLPKAH